MNLFRSSLRNKIGALMLAVSLVPLIIVGVIVLAATLSQLGAFSARIQETESGLRSNVVGANLTGAAQDTVADIDTYMLERIKDVRRWSEEPQVVAAAREGTRVAQESSLVGMPPDRVQDLLHGNLFIPITSSLYKPASDFTFNQVENSGTPLVELLVTDASGINLLITRPTTHLVHTDEAWWQAARARNVGGIGIDDAHFDADANAPVVGIALPIVDPDSKQILGVMRALFRLNELQARMSQKATSLDADIRVFNRDGLLIADTASNHSRALIVSTQGNVVKQNYEPALRALQAKLGNEGAGFMAVDNATRHDIVGYAHTNGSDYYDASAGTAGFEGFGWGVTVTQPENRALQVLGGLIDTANAFANLPNLLGGVLVGVVALALVGTLIGALLISGGISRPLVELARVTQRVQDGDLDARVPVNSQDEIGVLARAFNTMTAGLKERERERDVFGRVVSPEVREKLLNGRLELGGETRWVSVLFTDIRGFSTMAEKMSPQETVTFLNEYLTEMSNAIRPWGGYINNFIGDAIVAIFGAPIEQPNKEWSAVAAALTMRERLDELNKRRAARGQPPMASGIGISTGVVIAGQVGSLDRLLYTVIGDAVNIAQRLEELTKEYDNYPILINEATAQALTARTDLTIKKIGPVNVKGRAEAVEVYAVVSWSGSREGK